MVKSELSIFTRTCLSFSIFFISLPKKGTKNKRRNKHSQSKCPKTETWDLFIK